MLYYMYAQAMASEDVPNADIIAVWHTVWLTPDLLARFTKAKVSYSCIPFLASCGAGRVSCVGPIMLQGLTV